MSQIDNFLLIAEVCQVNVKWLLTGEGEIGKKEMNLEELFNQIARLEEAMPEYKISVLWFAY